MSDYRDSEAYRAGEVRARVELLAFVTETDPPDLAEWEVNQRAWFKDRIMTAIRKDKGL